MKNRFNNLTSKQWLPFQKSWYKFNNIIDLYCENILFFTQINAENDYSPNILLNCSEKDFLELKTREELAGRNLFRLEEIDQVDQIDFVLFDLLETLGSIHTNPDFQELIAELVGRISQLSDRLAHRKFICILAQNKTREGKFLPFAWQIGMIFQRYLTLKDEKIGVDGRKIIVNEKPGYFETTTDVVYSLYFRKDESSSLDWQTVDIPLVNAKGQSRSRLQFPQKFPGWQIVKPPPRNKKEILHPAKYPEVLIEKFITWFTRENDNVFDPMSGTGSTQIAALKLKRNGYGVELSEFFGKIAIDRCKLFITQKDLFSDVSNRFNIKIMDIRKVRKDDFPAINYLITSPPYWDMLNMKGAENQAKRRGKGLQLNYSDSEHDLGNISNYHKFVEELVEIYFKLFDLLNPGGFMTIIVKNIKKSGKNYPLAWDLVEALTEKYVLCPESFWFQDDLRIAPYGYGNTWVSNTFHHYCLNFQKSAG